LDTVRTVTATTKGHLKKAEEKGDQSAATTWRAARAAFAAEEAELEATLAKEQREGGH
jgi:hypothetical protein